MTLYFPELQHERAGSDRCERFGFARPMHTRAAVGQLLQGAAVMPFSRLLWRVLGEVGLADEVRGTEAGLRTVVGPAGTRLSGGQAQRLTVAGNLPTGVGRTWSRIRRASPPVPWREAVGQ